MKDWLLRQIDNNLTDFAGLTITGTVCFQDDLANEVLAEALCHNRRWRDAATHAGSIPSSTPVLSKLLPLIRGARIQTEPAAITIEFDVKV